MLLNYLESEDVELGANKSFLMVLFESVIRVLEELPFDWDLVDRDSQEERVLDIHEAEVLQQAALKELVVVLQAMSFPVFTSNSNIAVTSIF